MLINSSEEWRRAHHQLEQLLATAASANASLADTLRGRLDVCDCIDSELGQSASKKLAYEILESNTL